MLESWKKSCQEQSMNLLLRNLKSSVRSWNTLVFIYEYVASEALVYEFAGGANNVDVHIYVQELTTAIT